MRARILVTLLLSILLGAMATAPALARHGRHHHAAKGAAQGGNPNKGDVWVDTVTAVAGPGHEMDPHLPCANINLWGAKLADTSGMYTIDGWPPSGSKGTAYSSTWHYNPALADPQVIDVINVYTLITTAAANGDTPAAQGYHFKLQFGQDPQKHKTFWINCPPPGTPGGPGGTSGPPPPTTTPVPGTTTSAPSTSTPVSTGGVNTQAPSSNVKGTAKKKKKAKSKVLSNRARRRSGFTG